MAPPMQIAAAAMAPDASWAITVSADGTVRTWGTGVPPREVRRAVPVDGSQPVAVALAGDRIRVLWTDAATIRLHETVKGAGPREAEFAAPAPVRALALSPSGVLAAVACADGTLRTLNAGTGEFGPALATGGRVARAVAVASDIGPVVAVFPDGSVRRYDPAAGTSDMTGAGPGIDLVAVTPDGETVIAAKTDGVLSRLELSRAAEPAPGSDPPDLRWWESVEVGAITDAGATRGVPTPWSTADDDVRFASKGSSSPPGSPRPGGSGPSGWAPPPAPSPGGPATGADPAYQGTPSPVPREAPPARHRASRVAVRRRTLAVAALVAVVALVIILIWVLGS